MFGLIVIFSIMALVKNEVTYRHHTKISLAIYAYTLQLIEEGRLNERQVCYDDIESYNETFWRFWDWGPTRILIPEKYEIIRPYLEGCA